MLWTCIAIRFADLFQMSISGSFSKKVHTDNNSNQNYSEFTLRPLIVKTYLKLTYIML